MDKLGCILDQWEKNKDVESLLSQGLLDDPDAIQNAMEALSDNDREKASSVLATITSALECYIDDLSAEKADVKQQIDATFKSAQACLAYGSSAPRKSPERNDD